jgi:hypothetical protein
MSTSPHQTVHGRRQRAPDQRSNGGRSSALRHATRDVVQTVYIRRVERFDGQLVNVEFDKVDNVKDPVQGPHETERIRTARY